MYRWPRSATSNEAEPIEEGEDEETMEVPKAKNCHYRYCKDDMELVGRLKGTGPMWTMNVAQLIVLELGTLLPVIFLSATLLAFDNHAESIFRLDRR